MHATDRRILTALALLPFEATAATIARSIPVARSTPGRHLPALEAAGLVRSRWDEQASVIGALVWRLTGKGRALAETIARDNEGLAAEAIGAGGDGATEGAGDVAGDVADEGPRS